ncbi:MAG TPA: ChbG/HpnK family deacetylase [Rhizomicrobium sp.]
MTRIILCADDYGLSPAVSRGIRELLELGRLSATSCMVVYPEFAADGPQLKPFADIADIGLHFTMTANRPLRQVAAECFLRPPPISAIVANVEEQIERFGDAVGKRPDYIDGHQHVHLFPVVREAIVQVASRIGAYVRDASEPIDVTMWRRPAPLESAYLSCLSRSLSRLARRRGVATNRGFRGARNFRETGPYRDLFRRMISGCGDDALVMCHPGHVDPMLAARDSVLDAREAELGYIAGSDFLRDLSEGGFALSRLAPPIGGRGG